MLTIKDIPEQYQQQAKAKIGEQKKSKYNNTPTQRGQIRFDSKKEAARYDELLLMLKAQQIENLKLQPQYTLQEAYTTPSGSRIRSIQYVADFSYTKDGVLVVEDVKSKATKTDVYMIKKKLLIEKFGIEIQEV